MMVAIAAATATKYLALLPCIRCGGGRGPVYQCCMLLSLEKKRKKLYFSIFCIFALSGVAKQGRIYVNYSFYGTEALTIYELHACTLQDMFFLEIVPAMEWNPPWKGCKKFMDYIKENSPIITKFV
ncbi:hypothetical protein NC653_030955 [Populus alba x Populus x berolinensis]|uniref:Uncharacterized protein n=1 Tax=Populus alba x Populus x berolinensis TaxID=444605 RepID=A0AAD6LXP6_9ROSI|nr:hypothetical protein NC653_030955 [Populus alba x Populus x berolinensis]